MGLSECALKATEKNYFTFVNIVTVKTTFYIKTSI